MSKIILELKKLNKALAALENIYLKPNLEDRSNIDATIQRFEFTFELFWKLLRVFFSQQGLEINYPKEVLKEAYLNHFIEDEKRWFGMLRDRNLTSHTYDEVLADEIFKRIKLYVPMIRNALDKLEPLITDEKI